MIIKKYVGNTESEATEEAKRELGPNIVVMTVKPVKKTGFFSLFQPQKIEVTVGLEEESERPQRTFSPQKELKPAPRKVAAAEDPAAFAQFPDFLGCQDSFRSFAVLCLHFPAVVTDFNSVFPEVALS